MEAYYFDVLKTEIRDIMEEKRLGILKDKEILANLHQIEIINTILPYMHEDMEDVKELEQPLPTPPNTPPKIVEIDLNLDEELDE